LILLGLGNPLLSQDLGSLHIMNGDIALGEKTTLQAHTRLRTNQRLSQLFQFRGGPILYYRHRPWLQSIAGYYYIDEDTAQGNTRDFHRYFAGGQLFFRPTNTVQLEARTLLERFENTRIGDFWRFRERVWVNFGNGKVRPYVQGELLVQDNAQRQAVPLARAGSGFTVRYSAMQISLGYEFRQLPDRTRLHLITTNYTARLRHRP
jgi:hypothetical protein